MQLKFIRSLLFRSLHYNNHHRYHIIIQHTPLVLPGVATQRNNYHNYLKMMICAFPHSGEELSVCNNENHDIICYIFPPSSLGGHAEKQCIWELLGNEQSPLCDN